MQVSKLGSISVRLPNIPTGYPCVWIGFIIVTVFINGITRNSCNQQIITVSNQRYCECSTTAVKRWFPLIFAKISNELTWPGWKHVYQGNPTDHLREHPFSLQRMHDELDIATKRQRVTEGTTARACYTQQRRWNIINRHRELSLAKAWMTFISTYKCP